MQFLWDQITHSNGRTNVGGTGQPEQRGCMAVGDVIKVTPATDFTAASGPAGMEDYTCSAADVVAAGSESLAVLQAFAEWGAQYFANLLRVKRSPIPITIDPPLVDQYGIAPENRVVSDADLVVIMTAWPEPNLPLGGYASPLQTDEYNRVTVGQVNFVPNEALLPKNGQLEVCTTCTSLHQPHDPCLLRSFPL